MKTKTILVSTLVAVGLAVAVWILFNQPSPQETIRVNTDRPVVPEPPKNPATPAVPPAPDPDPSPAESAESVSPPQKARVDVAQNVAPQSKPGKKPKPPLQDPDARVAMSLVGIDPDAEAYWLEAIYDTSLPDQEREDLIEDLNEGGLSDVKHPGPEDLPVILYRLKRIEDIVATADDFMMPHLREAYKDLANLAAITQGGGEPVR